MHGLVKNLIGQTFNHLEVLSYEGKEKWNCLCACGQQALVNTYKLKSGHTKSCGCIKLEKGKARMDLRDVLTAPKKLFRDYQRRALKKNLDFELTFEECFLLFKGSCIYCKSEPFQIATNYNVDKDNDFIYNGIDRLDNSKGYTLSNSASCCKFCNYAKRDRTIEEFKEWSSKLYYNFTKDWSEK